MNWDWEKLRENQNKYEQQKDRQEKFRPPKMDKMFHAFKGSQFTGILGLAFLAVIIYLASSTFFTVDRNEVGVVQRFGKYNRLAQPGLNFKFPSGIEKVTKVNVKTPDTEEFGVNVYRGNTGYQVSHGQETSLMLTGDLNVAVVPWIVQYRRSDPRAYLFNVKNVKSLLRSMSEATMRTVVGDRSINEVISKRAEIALAAKQMLQQELDAAHAGISVVTIEMKKTNVPKPVQDSFNEVNQAIQEKEQTIYKAKEEYNKAIPVARGEAKRVIKDAEGYAIDRVNRAQGDATRFLALYKEYKTSKDVTQKRLHLESMKELLPRLGSKYIVDEKQKNLLPFLNMAPKQGQGTKPAMVKGE